MSRKTSKLHGDREKSEESKGEMGNDGVIGFCIWIGALCGFRQIFVDWINCGTAVFERFVLIPCVEAWTFAVFVDELVFRICCGGLASDARCTTTFGTSGGD